MREAWADSLKSLKIEKVYLHKDEFKLHYPNYASVKFPAIFVEENELAQIITAKDLESKGFREIISLLNKKIVHLHI
jgi:hypothetical protein